MLVALLPAEFVIHTPLANYVSYTRPSHHHFCGHKKINLLHNHLRPPSQRFSAHSKLCTSSRRGEPKKKVDCCAWKKKRKPSLSGHLSSCHCCCAQPQKWTFLLSVSAYFPSPLLLHPIALGRQFLYPALLPSLCWRSTSCLPTSCRHSSMVLPQLWRGKFWGTSVNRCEDVVCLYPFLGFWSRSGFSSNFISFFGSGKIFCTWFIGLARRNLKLRMETL